MLRDIYEKLLVVGGLDKPRMLFFDEAHLLFKDCFYTASHLDC